MGRFRRRQQPLVEAPEEEDDGPVPARFNFARDVVEAAAGDPFRSALTYVDREGIIDRRTFKVIAGDASRWASLLRSRGLTPGDRVLVFVGQKPAWLSVVLGALKAGFVTVPCPQSAEPQDVRFRVEHSGAQVVVVDAARASLVEGLELGAGIVVIEDVRAELGTYPVDAPTHDTAAHNTAFILYTSGTMGEPQGVIHTHANTWAARLQAEHWLDARRGDLVWCTAGTGTTQSIWNVLLGPWSCGAEVALHDGGFDVEERFDLLQRLGVTVLCQTPTEYRLMAEHPELEQFYLGNIRHAVSTGEQLGPEVIASFRIGFGLTIHDGYGQTENTILVANLPGTVIKPGSMGLPTPEHEVWVIDAEGNEQLDGVEGDIALRGHPPSLFGGYWNAPDLTSAAFRGGWYLTGDRAIRDQDGYLWFAGRSERATVSAAGRIQAYEIKSLLEPDDRPVRAAQPDEARVEPPWIEESPRLEEAPAAATVADEPPRVAQPDEARDQTAESLRLEQAQAAAVAAAAATEAAEAAAAAAAEAARQARGTAAEASRAAEARQAALARVEAEEQQRQKEAQRREAAIAAAAQLRRSEAEARRAAEVRADAEAQQRLEEIRRREAEIAAAAQARRDEAEAEQAAEAAALQRQADETRRREAEQATGEQARREQAESRRAAESRAKAEEQQRKQEERQRREAEKAAAEQARRDEAAARRASEAKAKEEERQRKQQEKQRREAEKAAAEQSRRDAAVRRADETRAREEEEQGRARAALLRAAEKGRKVAVGSPTPGPPTATEAAEEEEEGLSPELIDRLRAYGHGDDVPKRQTPTD